MERAVVVDAAGLLVPTTAAAGLRAGALAEACAELVGGPLGLPIKLVTAKVTRLGSEHVALVTLRLGDAAASTFAAGSAVAADEAAAVVTATARALGMESGLIAFAASRWRGRPGVRAITTAGITTAVADGDRDALAAHAGLVALAPPEGRLAITTAESAHEVLSLGAASISVTVERGSVAAAEVGSTLDALLGVAGDAR